MKVRWLDEPEEKDFDAARSYLSLLVPEDQLDGLIERLRSAPNGTLAREGHPARDAPAAAARRRQRARSPRSWRRSKAKEAALADPDRRAAPRRRRADRRRLSPHLRGVPLRRGRARPRADPLRLSAVLAGAPHSGHPPVRGLAGMHRLGSADARAVSGVASAGMPAAGARTALPRPPPRAPARAAVPLRRLRAVARVAAAG